jgi:hypothetical protein
MLKDGMFSHLSSCPIFTTVYTIKNYSIMECEMVSSPYNLHIIVLNNLYGLFRYCVRIYLSTCLTCLSSPTYQFLIRSLKSSFSIPKFSINDSFNDTVGLGVLYLMLISWDLRKKSKLWTH